MNMDGSKKIPQQRLPLSKKTKKWREECVEAFIDISKFGRTERQERLKMYYEYYNGIINDDDYNYVLKPYGKSRKNFPSKMRNYPIIKPIIDLLLGEKSKRPLNFTVAVKNGDSVSLKEEAKHQALVAAVHKMFIQQMLQQSDPETGTGAEGQADLSNLPKQVAEQFEDSYTDNRAIQGQAAINYIMQEQELYDKFQKQFFHFLVAGEIYSHKGVRRSEPFYDVINPLDVDYDKDPDIEFVEDGDWAMVRRMAHLSTVIDIFGEYLTDEQVLKLEDPKQQSFESYLMYENTASGDTEYRNRLIEVITVYWKSRKRRGFVSYTDPTTGTVEEFEVEEGYRMPAEMKELGGKITWEWVNEVWRGTRIDDDFFVDITPIENQRESLDNPSICKLPINGRRYSDVNAQNISLVGLGIPHQLNYNIYKYRLETSIARSKDIIAQFDINMIPKKWDMDKFMHFVEATGIAWVDYNKEGIQLSPQHQSVLDMSIKVIGQYIQLLESIKMEWEGISGVNRQRQGSIGQYEGKGSSQQAIVQSSHITEDIFRKFANFEQRELQGLLDYSKEAWLTGKKGMYVMPDTTMAYVDIDAMKHMESNYGVFVSDAGEDLEKLKQARGLSQAMLQNGAKTSEVLDIFESNSFAGIKSKIKKAERAREELEQAQAQAAQEQEAKNMQMQQLQMQQEALDKDKDRQTKIEVALINAEAQDSTDKNRLDLQKMMKDFELKEREIALKEQELAQKMNESPDE